jgi:D-glycero-D-manno-heptose 1,7-bisphosphate phosphatase
MVGGLHMIYTATEKVENDKPKECENRRSAWLKQAKKDFPEIDFERSVIVGDSFTDMQFGRNAGMKTVFIGDMTEVSLKITATW